MTQIKRILVPTDFSENAFSVYSFVRETAQNYGATVDLIHIIPQLSYLDTERDIFGNPFDDKDKYTKFRARIQQKLKAELEEQVPEENRGKIYIINEEKPAMAIVEHINDVGYDLVIIASRGRDDSIFNRGNVTERLVRLSPAPILSVTRGFDPEINTIMVPTDGSEVSMQALPLALLVADKQKAEIKLVSVSVFDSARLRIAGRSSYRYTDEEIIENVWIGLRDFVKNSSENELSLINELTKEGEQIKIRMNDLDPINVSIVVEKAASAHAGIIDYAIKNTELVVMATHGRGGMANLFLGSNAEKVVRHLLLPVLTIKPEFLT